MPLVVYIASILGALALLLMMPGRRRNTTAAGAVLGAATLGGLWLILSSVRWGDGLETPGLWYWLGGASGATMIYYYIFSFLAIIAAVRVITHPRPVYSALWFVMVVLASAGLFLVLSAEFMAFAMVIIYAGAILVTYMFVIMLATQSADPEFSGSDASDYDRTAREPVAAVFAGFLLLAVLLTVMFTPMERNWQAAGLSDAALADAVLADRAAKAAATPDEPSIAVLSGGVQNVERIGVDLFMGHPLGLELAGVLLLVSLIGAVAIARTRVEEEEQTQSAVAAATTGPSTDHEPGPHEPEAIGEVGGRMGV